MAKKETNVSDPTTITDPAAAPSDPGSPQTGDGTAPAVAPAQTANPAQATSEHAPTGIPEQPSNPDLFTIQAEAAGEPNPDQFAAGTLEQGVRSDAAPVVSAEDAADQPVAGAGMDPTGSTEGRVFVKRDRPLFKQGDHVSVTSKPSTTPWFGDIAQDEQTQDNGRVRVARPEEGDVIRVIDTLANEVELVS